MSTSPQRRLDYSLWIAWITGAAFIVPVLLVAAYYTTNADFMTWLWSEQGPLEISHVLIPLLAMGAGLSTLAARGRWFAARRAGLGLLAAAMCGLALMCGVIAGEEASWGQHFLGWSTPESWNELNDQHETNLHNIGSWADQKPRAIVELGVILFGIVLPVLDRLIEIRLRSAWRAVLPPLSVLPVTLAAEAVRLLESVPKLLESRAWSALPRPSELQEFYFYLFFALCMLVWRQRLVSGVSEAAGRDERVESQPATVIVTRRAA